ncbi:MAG: DUF1800 family protein [Verrucomicrobiota bacterium]
MKLPFSVSFLGLACLWSPGSAPAAGLDLNGNGLSDLWEARFEAPALTAAADTDGDGFSNLSEALAGTDPLSALSFPDLTLSPGTPGSMLLEVEVAGLAGKRYQLLASPDLSSPFLPVRTALGEGEPFRFEVAAGGQTRRFFRIGIDDVDSDGDLLTDAEEAALGFNAAASHTDRQQTADQARAKDGWNAANVISVGVLDDEMYERWPVPGVIAIRRSGGLKPLTVNFTLSGTAERDTDYTLPAGNSIQIPAGSREAWVKLAPVADAVDAEPDETITLTVTAGTGYTLGSAAVGSVTLHDESSASPPNPKAGARFLLQAAFGPDQDSADDADIVPENVEAVMAQGYSVWLDGQFAIAPQYHEPFVTNIAARFPDMYLDPKMVSWWNRALGTVNSYPASDTGVTPALPAGPPADYDPVRQRVAYSLSQIFVVSDRPETLAVEYLGMANYYDVLVRNALGNFRTLLFDVATHPVMGYYLSHVKNKKANAALNTFPDENFAREVMQLFSIGLWQLHPDGTRMLDPQGQPIPTYTNANITEFARVFTGLSYGPATQNNFDAYPNPPQWIVPMRGFDVYHDLAPKTLLNGAATPARTASSPDTGTATLLDVNAAVDNLFNHPNVGPFIGRLLIQRLVTSNPSPAYIGRVAAAFADNGSGVRGDMKAFIKAILLDPEARDGTKLADPAWGKPREPFLRCVNYARAFNAKSSGMDFYQVAQFNFDQQQQPYNSPSVFNFYLPNYTPPGVVGAAGLVAPEFQILNATTAVSSPNYFFNSISGRDLHRWGTAEPTRTVRPNLVQETALAPGDVDALIRRLDLHLTCGNLSPPEFQLIRESLLRVDPSVTSEWQKERVNLAVYLFLTSPAFSILR